MHVILKRFLINIVAVTQHVTNTVGMRLPSCLSYPARRAHAPYYIGILTDKQTDRERDRHTD